MPKRKSPGLTGAPKKVRGVAVGRFHYDSPPACVAFMQAFINDVVAREGDAPPLLRVSDATKYNGIVATVARLTPPQRFIFRSS